jgi:inner membrane protein
MMFYTHLVFSLLVSLVSIRYFDAPSNIFFIGLICLFGVIPDIDYYKSKVRIPVVSFFITLFLRHRGVFHSIFIPVLGYLSFSLMGLNYIGLPILIGYLSHLFLDMLTKSGVNLFWPFKFKLQGFFATNSILEKMLFILFLALDVFLLKEMFL